MIHTLEAASQEGEPPGSVSPHELPAAAGPFHVRSAWSAAPPTDAFVPDEPFRITLHHTAGPRPAAWEDAAIEMRLIQDFHQRGRGWKDIGYHFVIDGAGRVFEGRPQTVVGAHAGSNNDGNIGISLMGNFEFESMFSSPETELQLASLVRVARFLVARYGLSVDLFRGHRDYRPTTCPGRYLYPLLPRLRSELRVTLPAAPPHAPRSFRWPWEPGRTRTAIPLSPTP